MKFKPIILGGYVNGYSIARAIYEEYKVKSIIMDFTERFVKFSRILDYKITTNPNKNQKFFLEELNLLCEKELKKGNKPIIIATNDIWLIPVAKYKDELEKKGAIVSFSDWKIIENLTVKEKLYEKCESLDIRYPKTVIINRNNKEEKLKIKLPVLVKPSEVVEYVEAFPGEKRNFIFETEKDFRNFIGEKFKTNYNGKFIAQEYIQGGVSNLYTVTTYSNKNAKLKACSIGHKISQYPYEAGTITAGKTEFREELVEKARLLLEASKFFGISNIEFKLDDKTNEFVIIEINPRPGMWNYSSKLSGVDLFKCMIDELILNKKINFLTGKKEVIWSIKFKPNLKRILYKNREKKLYEKVKKMKWFNPLDNKNEGILYKIGLFLFKFKLNMYYLIKEMR